MCLWRRMVPNIYRIARVVCARWCCLPIPKVSGSNPRGTSTHCNAICLLPIDMDNLIQGPAGQFKCLLRHLSPKGRFRRSSPPVEGLWLVRKDVADDTSGPANGTANGLVSLADQGCAPLAGSTRIPGEPRVWHKPVQDCGRIPRSVCAAIRHRGAGKTFSCTGRARSARYRIHYPQSRRTGRPGFIPVRGRLATFRPAAGGGGQPAAGDGTPVGLSSARHSRTPPETENARS